eukprot:6577270-Pyramimonas_sp.AAC.2
MPDPSFHAHPVEDCAVPAGLPPPRPVIPSSRSRIAYVPDTLALLPRAPRPPKRRTSVKLPRNVPNPF